MSEFRTKTAFAAFILIGIGIGSAIGLCLVSYAIGLDSKDIDIIKAISFIFVGVAAIAGIFQLGINAKQAKRNTKQIEYSNKWNKKQLAATRLHESSKAIKAAITELHSTLDVLARKHDNPFRIYEIHNALGVFDNKNTLIFHKEQTEEDIKNLPIKTSQKELHINSFNDDIKGREVQDNIVALLNEYEFISMSVNNNIFEHETVKRLMSGKITKTYKKFAIYIEHLRVDHNYGPNVYKEFQLYAEQIEKELSKSKS